MEHKIHFKNEPFMAIVQGKGEKPITCIPVVYDHPFNFGLGIVFENGDGQIWGLVSPRNMITAWRGTEVLRLLNKIEFGTLSAAYYSGERNLNDSDRKRVKQVIDIIGKKAYDKIMSMPIPEKIIEAMIECQSDEFKPDLYPITDEVRVGTIKWREEFFELGIKHPFDVDAEDEKNARTIKKFSRLLNSYATSKKLPKECLGMNYVKGALLTILEKKGSEKYPDYTLIALAGVIGDLAVSDFATMILPSGASISKYEMDKRKEESIVKSAKWMHIGWGNPSFNVFRKRKAFSLEEAITLLKSLLLEYFPNPS
jgi:hypothetical protein